MAKKKDNSYYFRHDMNASEDPKLICLEDILGPTAYGYWWKILELMATQNCYLAYNRITFTAISKKLGISQEEVKTYLETCFELGLFRLNDDTFFFSERLLRDQQSRDGRSVTSAINGNLGGRPSKQQENNELETEEENTKNLNKKPNNLNGETYKPNKKNLTTKDTQERRGEESKENNIKEKEKKENSPSSPPELNKANRFQATQDELERAAKITGFDSAKSILDRFNDGEIKITKHQEIKED